MLFSQCNNMFSRKKEQLPDPDRIVFHCNGKAFSSDRDFIRAKGEGRSRNESTAHRMAGLDANEKLARAVEDYQQKVESYLDNQQMQEEKAAAEWGEEAISRSEINRMLSGVATICSQSETENEFYLVRVIVEIPVSNVIENQE